MAGLGAEAPAADGLGLYSNGGDQFQSEFGARTRGGSSDVNDRSRRR